MKALYYRLDSYILIRRNNKKISAIFAGIQSVKRYGQRTKYTLGEYKGTLASVQEVYQGNPAYRLYHVTGNEYCVVLGDQDERIHFWIGDAPATV